MDMRMPIRTLCFPLVFTNFSYQILMSKYSLAKFCKDRSAFFQKKLLWMGSYGHPTQAAFNISASVNGSLSAGNLPVLYEQMLHMPLPTNWDWKCETPLWPKVGSHIHSPCAGGSEEWPSVTFSSSFTSVTEGVNNPDRMGLQLRHFPFPLALFYNPRGRQPSQHWALETFWGHCFIISQNHKKRMIATTY